MISSTRLPRPSVTRRFAVIRRNASVSQTSFTSEPYCDAARHAHEPQRDSGSAKNDQRAREKHGAYACAPGDPSQRRVRDSQREIEKRSEGSHRKAPTLRRHVTDRFYAEAGIDERVAEASERGADEHQRGGGGEP